MRTVHVELFAGQAGKLFLGFMRLLMLAAIVSGVVLYAPFMRKLRFGDVRRDRSPRVKAAAAARAREPGMKIGFIAFPGTGFATPHHDGVFMRGREALTERLLQPGQGIRRSIGLGVPTAAALWFGLRRR